ncbi:MAG: mmgC15, partial [Mycobacterium sp.]|nr:mmgC15 [Mycobacterium sp.]
MDLSLSPEQEQLRRTVRKWVEDVVVPPAIENDRLERFPTEALEGLRDLGLLGLTIPEEYGGGAADPFSYVLTVEELARGDANVRSILSVHLGLVAGSVARWGTDEQKQRWLPAMAT